MPETGAEKLGKTHSKPATPMFHASIHELHGFRPLTHFGSLRAAIERLATRSREAGFVYPVSLTIDNAVTVTDGTAILHHQPSAYARRFSRSHILTTMEADAIARASVLDGEEAARGLLCSALHRKGFDGLRYRNKYEDAGSISWCILEPRQAIGIGAPMVFTMDEMVALLDAPDFVDTDILASKLADGDRGPRLP